MKNGNLLLGLGLGAAIGAALGYFLASDKKDKIVDELHHSFSEVKEGMRNVCSKMRSKVEEAKEEWGNQTGKPGTENGQGTTV